MGGGCSPPKAAAAPDQKHSKFSAVCALHIPPRWSLCRKTADIPAVSPFGAFRRLVFDFPNINRKQYTIRCARNIIISFLCLRKSFEENNSFLCIMTLHYVNLHGGVLCLLARSQHMIFIPAPRRHIEKANQKGGTQLRMPPFAPSRRRTIPFDTISPPNRNEWP